MSEFHTKIFKFENTHDDLPLIDSLIPSPMYISNNNVPTNTKKVVSESHHAEILSLPWQEVLLDLVLWEVLLSLKNLS